MSVFDMKEDWEDTTNDLQFSSEESNLESQPSQLDNQSNDTWDSFESQPSNSNATWNSFESQPNNSNATWNSFESQPSNNNDTWDSQPSQSSSTWGSQPNNNVGGSQQHEPTIPPQIAKFNFSTKAIGIILGGIILVVALIFLFFDSISFTKKEPVKVAQQTPTTQITGLNLAEVTPNIELKYIQTDLVTTGVVTDKKIYVTGNQIMYSLDINIGTGVLSYLCSENVYNSIAISDVLTINYKVVNDKYMSISSITK